MTVIFSRTLMARCSTIAAAPPYTRLGMAWGIATVVIHVWRSVRIRTRPSDSSSGSWGVDVIGAISRRHIM